jgi:2-polyprenyl-3-methyl-5-hydroxy-6-metoxy-1,4-benzoquinol methylase
MMKQYDETLRLYRAEADDWQRKSANKENQFSTIFERNRTALSTLKALGGKRDFLDVGCGTGQLAIAAAQAGHRATGIDFSPEMIRHCEENRKKAGVSVDFKCGSVFDFDFGPDSLDVISGMGFIEYFSPEEMMDFFQRAFRMLRSGGALVVGSRNRLFNLFSHNAFTMLELGLGTVEALLKECVALEESETQEQAFAALQKLERIDPQPDAHPSTGVPVTRRPQYSPADLVLRLRTIGFAPRRILPIHFHGLPIPLMREHPQMHNDIAQAISDFSENDHRVIPQCSTFVMEVRKPLTSFKAAS